MNTLSISYGPYKEAFTSIGISGPYLLFNAFHEPIVSDEASHVHTYIYINIYIYIVGNFALESSQLAIVGNDTVYG